MNKRIFFVHGMFQNPKSWEKWIAYFKNLGYDSSALAWPLHAGEPAALRANTPPGLGELRLKTVVDSIAEQIGTTMPIVIGHSVGGLIAQILLSRKLVTEAVAISSVAPNGMIDFDLMSLKNLAVIANPFKGNEPVYMDAKTFHGAFANTLDEAGAAAEFERTATHDSRNVLRDCMGKDGTIDETKAHAPLLLIAGEKDEIIPQHLVEKNAKAYEDAKGIVTFKAFSNRSHYICNEPGWQEVCAFTLEWIKQNSISNEERAAKLSAA